MKKLIALCSLLAACGLWYASTEHDKGSQTQITHSVPAIVNTPAQSVATRTEEAIKSEVVPNKPEKQTVAGHNDGCTHDEAVDASKTAEQAGGSTHRAIAVDDTFTRTVFGTAKGDAIE